MFLLEGPSSVSYDPLRLLVLSPVYVIGTRNYIEEKWRLAPENRRKTEKKITKKDRESDLQIKGSATSLAKWPQNLTQ